MRVYEVKEKRYLLGAALVAANTPEEAIAVVKLHKTFVKSRRDIPHPSFLAISDSRLTADVDVPQVLHMYLHY